MVVITRVAIGDVDSRNPNNGETMMNEAEFAKFAETHSRQQLVAEIRRMAKRLADGAAKLEQHAKEAEGETKPQDGNRPPQPLLTYA